MSMYFVWVPQAFSGHEFVSVAEVSKRVPVLSCGAVSKKFMIPGWRVGWILIHDKEGAFDKEVRTYAHNLRVGG